MFKKIPRRKTDSERVEPYQLADSRIVVRFRQAEFRQIASSGSR
jgi:hypothetical protein